MESSTMSSAPASPTEGDNPCDTNGSNVAIHTVTLLISLCGLAGNGAVIWLLRLKFSNATIFDLAVIDFFFLLVSVPTALLFLVEDVSCSTIMPLVYVNSLFQVSRVPCYWGLCQLTAFTMANDRYKLCLLCCRLPKRLVWVVDSLHYWAFVILYTLISTVTSLCPSDKQEHCQRALFLTITIILILFAAPDLIYKLIGFINAKCGSQHQQLKKRDIVIFLIVFFTLHIIIWNCLQQLGYIVVSSQVVFLLTCINSSSKPFVYFLVGRCWRKRPMRSLKESLQRVFEEQEDNSASPALPAFQHCQHSQCYLHHQHHKHPSAAGRTMTPQGREMRNCRNPLMVVSYGKGFPEMLLHSGKHSRQGQTAFGVTRVIRRCPCWQKGWDQAKTATSAPKTKEEEEQDELW